MSAVFRQPQPYAGGIRDLLDTNNAFSYLNLSLQFRLVHAQVCAEMTMRWTSEVPS